MAAPVDPREVQSLQTYLNQYTQQAEVYSRQLGMMEEGIREANASIETLKALAEAGEAPVFMPIGGGLNIRATIIQPDEVFVSIGSDIIVQKTNEGAISYLQDRIKEMEATAKNLTEVLQKIDAQVKDIQKRLEQLYRQAQAEQQGAGSL
ncbi:Prefoldin alpha subunit [Methanospirillum hungatei JF-1]|uniref:Prefoldin subunit alpha n=1 Tax=Methanospirillum hungatei JF-1 (strain ATCC 27890 / DSM 864 / NBRC 100397 / JF-1) TaxID=323259 RepID=PFDA_METHJ|nr:prefoldin subunit alpha [Methanospirillum hungatei]Q2FS96.1 RecName: Full=Prefoldin subunit alpha; AltName: Full=GimC subunit alpha [Methanospirillum hungatei JF-1]MBP7034794.1 prefoldin subunit alpha [Methanospirillum sp.]OQA56812.1 MAG: Prefoldin subunit alpha [Euryarchaeota archaeon ADurb.Bin294]ABD42708.1 Prefoldin alpha subunit [Methanospirillum hungatei JF-1]MBP9008993.1 prefoldin subunit alpha [Methanospirillum sp.]HOW05502.1 prefoldin subunit alpha [Methanospirillum hungatei]